MKDKGRKLAAFAKGGKGKAGKGIHAVMAASKAAEKYHRAQQRTAASKPAPGPSGEHHARQVAESVKKHAETMARPGIMGTVRRALDSDSHEQRAHYHAKLAVSKGHGHMEQGPHGGQYYVSPTGEKHYVGSGGRGKGGKRKK